MGCQMQAVTQAATTKINIPKANSIKQPASSVIGEKIMFKSLVITSVARSASSSVRLSFNAKKLIQTNTPKREHLIKTALDDKML